MSAGPSGAGSAGYASGSDRSGRLPLADLRVVDLSTVLAGPGCTRHLADFGADVIRVEHPDGDGLRRMGWLDPADDVSLFWKLVGRNKRLVALDLKDPEQVDVVRRLVDTADVVVENFRPGKLEALGLVPEQLIESNPRLVITRVTAFGQDGPYATRPGFATLAEAMSGFASINGQADGPPLLPPIALTDEVTALAAAFATMVAVHSGVGQVVDVTLLETMLQLLGPLVPASALLGYEQPRMGSSLPYTAPRGTFQTSDGRWVAVSTSAETVAARVLALIGLDGDPRFASAKGRLEHRDSIDAELARWIGAHSLVEVLERFDAAQAAAAPVLGVGEALVDPQVVARGAIVGVDGIPMQGAVARLSRTPAQLRWAGGKVGADQEDVLRDAREGAS